MSDPDNGNLFLAEVTAAVHIINVQLLLLVKTYCFGVRLTRGRAKFLRGVIIDQNRYCQHYSVCNNYYLNMMAECSKMIHQVPCSVLTVETCSSPSIFLQALQMTWDPGVKHKD